MTYVKSLLLIFVISIYAVPPTLHYQGRLTNAAGVGENASYDMEFRIYDVETGGVALWSQSLTGVEVSRGLFDAELTEIDIPFDGQYWMEIVVDGDVMSPRVKLASSAYAFRAEIADSIAGGDLVIATRDTMIAHWDSIRGIPEGFADGIDNGLVRIRGSFSPWIDDEATIAGGTDIEVTQSGNTITVSSTASGSDTDWTVADSVMYATSSSRVGIGTDEPTARLDIRNNEDTISVLNVYGADATTTIETKHIAHLIRPDVTGITNANSAGFAVGSYQPGATGKTRLDLLVSGVPSGDNSWGRIPDINVMSLLANGKVGIGTIYPVTLLDVAGKTKTDEFQMMGGSGDGYVLISDLSGNASWSGNICSAVTGNIGIGTSSPQGKLHIYTGPYGGALYDDNSRLIIESDDHAHLNFFVPSDRNSAIGFGDTEDNYNGFIRYDHNGTSSPYMDFAVDDVPIMTLKDGNVGIAQANPQEKLDVNGVVAAEQGFHSQDGQVKRDFLVWQSSSPDLSENKPAHIKTNIARGSLIMYRFLVEGYHYGSARLINSAACGCSVYDSGGPYADQTQDFSNGADISLYYSSDDYLVVKLSFADNSFGASFSVSAWFTGTNGNAWDISATVYQQVDDL